MLTTSQTTSWAPKVGIIYDSSDAYSRGVHDKFQAEAAEKGLEIVADEAFTSDNKSDCPPRLRWCQEAGADLVSCPSTIRRLPRS